MWKTLRVMILSCLIELCGGSHLDIAAAQRVIATGNEHYPPSSWVHGDTIVGVAAELLQLIGRDMGVPVESRYVGPWKRAQLAARTGKVDVITTIYKNADRETYLLYTDQPYMDDPNVIWVWKGRAFSFAGWEDLIGKRGGAILGDSYGEAFDTFATKNLTLERVHTIALNFKKLQANRIDYMPYGLYAGMIAAKQLGYSDHVEYLRTPFLSEGMYLALSKHSPFQQYLPEINAAIRKYKADGTIDRLIQQAIEQYTTTH